MALFKRKPLEKIISNSLSTLSDRRGKPVTAKSKKELAETLILKKEERMKELNSAAKVSKPRTKTPASPPSAETDYETLLKSARQAEARDAQTTGQSRTITAPKTNERRNLETRPFTSKTLMTQEINEPEPPKIELPKTDLPEVRQPDPPIAPLPKEDLMASTETAPDQTIADLTIPDPTPPPLNPIIPTTPSAINSGPAMQIETDPYDSDITDADTGYEASDFDRSEGNDRFDRVEDFDESDDYEVSLYKSDAFEPPLRPSKTRSRADINALRTDVDSLVSDLQNGESLYRRAQTRIENLSRSVEEAESGFTLLNRLQPENLKLKARNKLLIKDYNETSRELKIVEAELSDHQQWLAERTEKLESVSKQLSESNKSLHEYERTLKDVQQEGDQYRIDLVQAQSKLDVERRENHVMKKRINVLSDRLEERNIQALEVKKTIDSLKDDWEDFRSDAQRLERENSELRDKLDDAVKSRNTLKGRSSAMSDDIRSLKSQHEFDMIARDEQILALEGRIRDLTRENEIKDSIVRDTCRDMADLKSIRSRQQIELENKRYDRFASVEETEENDDDEGNIYDAIAFDPDRAERRLASKSRRRSDSQNEASLQSDDYAKEPFNSIDKHYEEISATLSKMQSPKRKAKSETATLKKGRTKGVSVKAVKLED